MARKTSTKSKAPIAPKPRAPKPKPAPKAVAPTSESLLAQIATQLDRLDEFMDKRKQPLSWRYQSYQAPLTVKQREPIESLVAQLDRLLNPKHLQSKFDIGRKTAMQTFTLQPGVAVKWSRPGQFIMWLGDIPMRCKWDGVLSHDHSMYPLDPRGLWIDPQASRGVTINVVDVDCATVEGYFRSFLMNHVKPYSYNGKPHELYQIGAEAAADVRAFLVDPASAWWVEQIAKGPVNPVPMPDSIRPVQQRLFG